MSSKECFASQWSAVRCLYDKEYTFDRISPAICLHHKPELSANSAVVSARVKSALWIFADSTKALHCCVPRRKGYEKRVMRSNRSFSNSPSVVSVSIRCTIGSKSSRVSCPPEGSQEEESVCSRLQSCLRCRRSFTGDRRTKNST